jgi:ABC-type glycerol-3-phosphate transport system substrate-binding protein
MHPIRRQSLTFLLIAAIAVMATACGSNDAGQGGGGSPGASQPGAVGGETGAPGSSGAASGGAVSGDLQVWAMGNEGELLSSMADKFMEENPDVNVEVTPIAWDQAVTRLQTAIGGGQTPCVSQMGTDMMGQFVATGAIDPVGEGIDPSAFFEGAWNSNVVDGTAYGVPWYVETRVLYERTDIAEKGGVTEPPATWDDLTATAKAMKEQGGADWGIGLGTKNYQEYVPFLWSNGGDIMNDAGEFTLDSPEAVEALTYYDSFFEDGLAPSEVPEGTDPTQTFVSGTTPMMFSGPWHMGLITDAGGADIEGKWGVSTIPANDSATSFVGGANLVVYTDCDNKDAAWAFVNFLTRPDTQVAWYEQATVLPAVQEAWTDPKLADDPNVAVFGEQLKDGKTPPAISTWSEIANAINDQLERMTVGNATPEEAAKAMQEAATSIGTGN